MSKLGIEQKNVKTLLGDDKSDFLIPDYQRPYAWEEKECQTLWEDIFMFAFPDNNSDKFNRKTDEYFLGPIVTFLNSDGQQEVIDGQQRLTTLMLMLRAFYRRFDKMMDEQAKITKKNIEQCIWKTDEYGRPTGELKICSEVATDNDREEFHTILKTGEVTEHMKSQYAQNYRFFQKQIAIFLDQFPSYFTLLPTRILNNCILLPIEAESQDTALRIFSTLNDRGKPLSDSDIFKAQFYKYYTSLGQKTKFIERWKQLEDICDKIFHPIAGTPMDEAFTRYMYYERAKQGQKSSTVEALRKFYEHNTYSLLKQEETFDNIIDLVNFWKDIENQNSDRFSDDILRKLFVLNYAPNGMWTYIVSVYYLANRDTEGLLEENSFSQFLSKITAFIWTYAVVNPGVNALRTPIFAEMVNIVNHIPVSFKDFRFDMQQVSAAFDNYVFSNNRPITKAMLTWWAFNQSGQKLLSLETGYEIEHIFAKNRQLHDKSLQNNRSLENLGNKILIEKRINIRASDYKFTDKKKYYLGFINARKQLKEGTQIAELRELAENMSDFTEKDIAHRKTSILFEFTNTFLIKNDLIENE